MLCLSANHMMTLCPDMPCYSRAATRLLNSSLQAFHQILNSPFILKNCYQVLGTSILIHYLCWCNLGFLEGHPALSSSSPSTMEMTSDDSEQDPEEDQSASTLPPLDLSGDQLFSLSSGVRQVLHVAQPALGTDNERHAREQHLNPHSQVHILQGNPHHSATGASALAPVGEGSNGHL